MKVGFLHARKGLFQPAVFFGITKQRFCGINDNRIEILVGGKVIKPKTIGGVSLQSL